MGGLGGLGAGMTSPAVKMEVLTQEMHLSSLIALPGPNPGKFSQWVEGEGSSAGRFKGCAL